MGAKQSIPYFFAPGDATLNEDFVSVGDGAWEGFGCGIWLGCWWGEGEMDAKLFVSHDGSRHLLELFAERRSEVFYVRGIWEAWKAIASIAPVLHLSLAKAIEKDADRRREQEREG